MVYAMEPLQGIVKENEVLVKEKYSSEERQRVVEGVSRGKEMAGSVTKLESSSSSDESGIRTCNQGLAGQRM